jgi:hypothetical protein
MINKISKLQVASLANLIDAIRESSERVWVAHSQLKGKRLQRLLLPKSGGCQSIAVILAELACNSLPLHGETHARFSVIPPLGEKLDAQYVSTLTRTWLTSYSHALA